MIATPESTFKGVYSNGDPSSAMSPNPRCSFVTSRSWIPRVVAHYSDESNASRDDPVADCRSSKPTSKQCMAKETQECLRA